MFSITIKVSTSRDESCNPFTLSETYDYTEHDMEVSTVQEFVKSRVIAAREHFMDCYPSNQGKPSTPSLLPTDVTVTPLAKVESF